MALQYLTPPPQDLLNAWNNFWTWWVPPGAVFLPFGGGSIEKISWQAARWSPDEFGGSPYRPYVIYSTDDPTAVALAHAPHRNQWAAEFGWAPVEVAPEPVQVFQTRPELVPEVTYQTKPQAVSLSGELIPAPPPAVTVAAPVEMAPPPAPAVAPPEPVFVAAPVAPVAPLGNPIQDPAAVVLPLQEAEAWFNSTGSVYQRDGLFYQPIYTSEGQGETYQRGPLIEWNVYATSNPGDSFKRLGPNGEFLGYGAFQSVALLPSWEDIKPFVAIAAAAVGLNSVAAAFTAPTAATAEAAALSVVEAAAPVVEFAPIAELAPAFTPAVDSQIANVVLGLEPVTAVTAPATWAEVVTQVVTEAVAPVVEAVAPVVDVAPAFTPAVDSQIANAVLGLEPVTTLTPPALWNGVPTVFNAAVDSQIANAVLGLEPVTTLTPPALWDGLPTGILSDPTTTTAATTAATTTATTAATTAASGIGALNTIGQVLGIGTAVANVLKPTPGATLGPGTTAKPITTTTTKPGTAATAGTDGGAVWGLVAAGLAAGYMAIH